MNVQPDAPGRGRRWIFTDMDVNELKWLNLPRDSYKSCVIGRETCPTTRRPHLQGMIVLTRPWTLSALKRLSPTAHWERMKGTPAQARIYCIKDGNVLLDVFEESQQGKRTDLAVIAAACKEGGIRAVAASYPEAIIRYPHGIKLLSQLSHLPCKRPVVSMAYVGPTGIGKSFYAMMETDKYVLTPPNRIEDKCWFDGYQGEKTLIIDEYYGTIKWNFLLRIMDPYELMVEVKGGMVAAAWTKVIFTSNTHPRNWYPDQADTSPLMRRFGCRSPYLMQADWGENVMSQPPFGWRGPAAAPSPVAPSQVIEIDD